jgi:hypothetical protein
VSLEIWSTIASIGTFVVITATAIAIDRESFIRANANLVCIFLDKLEPVIALIADPSLERAEQDRIQDQSQ